jgi:hypothetical protein
MIAPAKNAPQQLYFPSIEFPADRSVLRAGEVADRWRCSLDHIIDLLEAGKLSGFDITGRHEYVRVPVSAIQEMATLFNVPSAAILQIIAKAKSNQVRSARAHWRIPKEGYNDFIKENHSLAK